ncbi:condensin-2 complex subunit G2, putative [Plasmodium vinckei]|uniref:Condensin-2 complex subunit G2, putative n=1 Tax=Plasmodium vinckei TaxID=5860 RepID=A0A6V7TBN4_PLAVN|nr:condensin-2 complex subunit G2, putative [Plasmodium vinckei]
MYQKVLDNIKELPEFKLLCKKKTELLSIFKSCKNKEIGEIWIYLGNKLEEHINHEKLNFDKENKTLLFLEEKDRQYLLCCISFIFLYLQHLENNEKKNKHISFDEYFEALFNKITELQFMLSDKDVRESFGKCLLQMCELNLKDSIFSENVKINVLLFLLWRCCSSEGKGVDISKLKKYKDFCKYIKWETPEKTIDSFCLLCSYSLNLPKFYENADGKLFLSYVWLLHESIASHLFSKMVHNTVLLSYEAINHYCEIIYMAWKNSSGEMQFVVENQIEYLVQFSIKCPIKIASRFRYLLNIFHTNKGDKNVNNLIFKIYDPVIWRNLMSANWKIRFNTVCIFQLIFPVVDPCIKNINYLQEMEKAYNALFDMCEDENSCVLQAIAKCICYVINELWEIISEDKRTKLFDTLINKLLRGKSYDNVKTEVVLGFCEMAKNKKINKIFIQIFDRIKYLINDKCLRVRKNFIILVLELNKNINPSFSNEIDYNELNKRITKDFFTFNIECCIKKLSYLKQEHHEKINNKEICEFLRLASNLITYSMWDCEIKEQAKKCINLLNEYPVLMICISKFSTNLKLIDRYNLACVLFEITNIKLGEEDNMFLLKKTEDKNKVHCKNYLKKCLLLKDPILNKKFIRYSSLLICIYNFLKLKNDEEMEACNSEHVQEFLKTQFSENFFIDSINTLMEPYYFKILKHINLDMDNYLSIHKYGCRQLNSLYKIKNENMCKSYIIPLFFKWGMLETFFKKNIECLNKSIEYIFSNLNANEIVTSKNSEDIDNTGYSEYDGSSSDIASSSSYSDTVEKTGKESIIKEGIEKRRKNKKTNETDYIIDDNDGEKKRNFKKKQLANQKEMNALIFLSIVVKKKKYHNSLFKNYSNIIHNFICKFNYILLHMFEKIYMKDFILPAQLISKHNDEKKINKMDIDIVKLPLYDKIKIEKYMCLYVSFFFFGFNIHFKQNNISCDWDLLISNTTKCIEIINSIKFINEIEITKNNGFSKNDHSISNNTQLEDKKREWTSYISIIIHLTIYFLDMVEYTISMKKLDIEYTDFNNFIKNIFLFYKCYEIISSDKKKTIELYLKIWNRLRSFLLVLLNFDYFENKLENKLSIVNTFFLFTYDIVPKKNIEDMLKKYHLAYKQKETFSDFLQNFKKNNDNIDYMESHIKNTQEIFDNMLSQKMKTKRG